MDSLIHQFHQSRLTSVPGPNREEGRTHNYTRIQLNRYFCNHGVWARLSGHLIIHPLFMLPGTI